MMEIMTGFEDEFLEDLYYDFVIRSTCFDNMITKHDVTASYPIVPSNYCSFVGGIPVSANCSDGARERKDVVNDVVCCFHSMMGTQ